MENLARREFNQRAKLGQVPQLGANHPRAEEPLDDAVKGNKPGHGAISITKYRSGRARGPCFIKKKRITASCVE